MTLTKEELFILRICNEEPNNIKGITKESKIPKKRVSQILKNLEEKGLIYYDKDIEFWSSTVNGTKELSLIRSQQDL